MNTTNLIVILEIQGICVRSNGTSLQYRISYAQNEVVSKTNARNRMNSTAANNDGG